MSDSIGSIEILVIALWMVLRDADILVHVESLHIFEAHFARLVCLEGDLEMTDILKVGIPPGPVFDTSQGEFRL